MPLPIFSTYLCSYCKISHKSKKKMKDFESLIMNRRSTRKFSRTPLDADHVEMIMKAGLLAPASKRRNPWQFVVVEDKGMLENLSRCKPQGAAFLEGCSMATVVLGNVMESDTWVEDASISAIFMQLQAEDLGVGSCWCQIRGREHDEDTSAADYVRSLLGIPYQMEVLCILGFGYKEQAARPKDESALQWEKIHLGTYRMPAEGARE